ncbi:hypothetical protein G7Z17_g8573 [Cylindrodendrum hubeiense]|uniref:Uncharacterized protein n=1 Tax=Cylindrodendrum hubeiense TaxID=595255 RepID=A0A9P5LD29_9HYPO|nr:hypothetical protein G7Z17_g8573 [Cylindrodendrum hubeiense]
MVKISKVIDDVAAIDFSRMYELDTCGSPKAPPMLHVKALLLNLEAVQNSLGPELSKNNHPTKLPGFIEFGRTECLHACVHAIKQGLDNWFTFTPEEVFGMPLPLMLQFGHYTHVLYRLAMREDPAWDRATVRNAVDLIQTLERGAEVLCSVSNVVGLQGDGSDFFSKCATTLRSAIPVWRRAFEESSAAMATEPGAQNGLGLGTVAGAGAPENLVPMDFSVDPWFSDVFSSWETYSA